VEVTQAAWRMVALAAVGLRGMAEGSLLVFIASIPMLGSDFQSTLLDDSTSFCSFCMKLPDTKGCCIVRLGRGLP
jgi:hypothetical protein